MSTNISWPPIGGSAYTIPASGEVNWPTLSNFLIALADAQGTTSQKLGIRVATTTPVTVGSAADCVVITQLAAPGAVSVNLPAGVAGQMFCIVDGTGDAATNNITIDPNGAQTINGAATFVINRNRGGVIISFTGTNWTILSTFGMLVTPVSILEGGTGQTTANAALNALLPSQTSNSGKALLTDGTNSAWQTIPANGGTFLAADGTVSAPGLAFNSDTNTGFYRIGTDNIGLASGGVLTWQVSSDGAMTAGPTSGSTLEHFFQSGANTYLALKSASNSLAGIEFYNASSAVWNILNVGTAAANTLEIRNAGNTAIATATQTGALTLGSASTTGVSGYTHDLRAAPTSSTVMFLRNMTASSTIAQIQVFYNNSTSAGYWGASSTNALQVTNAAGSSFLLQVADATGVATLGTNSSSFPGNNLYGKKDGVVYGSGFVGEMFGTQRAGTNGSAYSFRATTTWPSSIGSLVSTTLDKGIYLVTYSGGGFAASGSSNVETYLYVGGTAVTNLLRSAATTAGIHGCVATVPIIITADGTAVAMYGLVNGGLSITSPTQEMWITRIG